MPERHALFVKRIKMRKVRPPSEYRVEALARGLAVLDAFAGDVPKLGVTDVARIAGLPTSTTFRLLATLEVAGYLERLPDGEFRPSFRVLRLGDAALRGSDLVEVSSGILRHLAESTGLSVNLGVLNGDHVLYLIRQRGTALVSANLQVGSTLPAVYSSMGKVMLAFLEPKDLEARLQGWDFSSGLSTRSVRSLTALKRQLAQVRVDGYSAQDEEVAPGLRAIAAPVRNSDGRVVAAVNLASTASEFDLDLLISRFRGPLLDVARDLSSRLGHDQ